MIEKIRWDIIVLYIDVAFQDLTPNLRWDIIILYIDVAFQDLTPSLIN